MSTGFKADAIRGILMVAVLGLTGGAPPPKSGQLEITSLDFNTNTATIRFSGLDPAKTATLYEIDLQTGVLTPQQTIPVPSPGPVVGVVIEGVEGELGTTPEAGDLIFGSAFIPEPEIAVLVPGILARGLITSAGAASQDVQSVLSLHPQGVSSPRGSVPLSFNTVGKLKPEGARWLGPGGIEGVFAQTHDGSMSGTEAAEVSILDSDGSVRTVTLDNIKTFMFPDDTFAKVDVVTTPTGEILVGLDEFLDGMAPTPQVKVQRINGTTGQLIGDLIDISGTPGTQPEIAALDMDGNAFIVCYSSFSSVKGNVLDLSGPAPSVGPVFQINTTTGGFGHAAPRVGSDPSTGAFTVVWEHITGVSGNPVDIRARRFDAMGNPIGPDFVVNETTANAQGQAGCDSNEDGLTAVVWAGDNFPFVAADGLDIFSQVYDAEGNPIGGEIRVNTDQGGNQDRPSVSFLPSPDSEGRPQFVVVWRDVELNSDTPRGTGTKYKCFSVEVPEQPESVAIFEDGFESGDTVSWSASQP